MEAPTPTPGNHNRCLIAPENSAKETRKASQQSSIFEHLQSLHDKVPSASAAFVLQPAAAAENRLQPSTPDTERDDRASANLGRDETADWGCLHLVFHRQRIPKVVDFVDR
jgi:hypothetical protein